MITRKMKWIFLKNLKIKKKNLIKVLHNNNHQNYQKKIQKKL